jgi:3-polyprenyl-4-hydroxybenzoate decarboxylase
MPETICLAFTGASGMPYGVRLLECLLAAGCRVQLLYSQVAQIVARQEIGLDLPARASEARRCLQERFPALPGRLEVYGREEWFAPVASGSNPRRRHGHLPVFDGNAGGSGARTREQADRAGGRRGHQGRDAS